MDNDISAVIIDNGSGTIKAGFDGEDSPRTIFPSVVGHLRSLPGLLVADTKDTYVGMDAQDRRDILDLKYPIEHGIIRNWDDMKKIWQHTFQHELHLAPEDSNSEKRPVLLTESPLNPKVNREMTMQIMFEAFDAPAMYLSAQPVLSLYATARTTGSVLESGEGVTHSVSIYDGFQLPHATLRFDLAGGGVTDYLEKILSDKCGFLAKGIGGANQGVCRDMKEKLCYVALDFEREEEACAKLEPFQYEKAYELPDGNVVNLKNERFQAPEALFQPSLVGYQCHGFPKMTYNTIFNCDPDIQRELCGNIILSGGNTTFPRFADRMQRELSVLIPSDSDKRMKVHIVAPANRKYLAWVGGSILTSLSTFRDMWVSLEEYDEYGPSVVHRRCL